MNTCARCGAHLRSVGPCPGCGLPRPGAPARSAATVLLGLSLVGPSLAGCQSLYGITVTKDAEPPMPDLVVSPADLAFGEVVVGETAEALLTLQNVGDDLLTTESVYSDPADEGFALVDPPPELPFALEPGETRDLGVAFTPEVPGDVAAALVVTSDDPDAPEIRVPLAGTGT